MQTEITRQSLSVSHFFANPLRTILSPMDAAILKLFAFDEVWQLYEAARREGHQGAVERVLATLAIGYQLDPQEIENIPRSGPVVAVANHPFGLLDGALAAVVLPRIRPDVRILANSFLAVLPGLSEQCIFIDPFGDKDAVSGNARALYVRSVPVCAMRKRSRLRGAELNVAGRVIGTLWLLGGAIGACAQSLPEKLIAEGHWKRARAIVEARLHAAPGDPLANFLFSQVRNAFGDREAPLPAAEQAVALDGHTAKYHRQLAEVLGVTAQHANVFQQALLARRFRKEIDTALVLDARDTQAWRDLMEFYLLAPGIIGGDEARAASTAQRLAAIDPVEGFLAEARLAAYHQQPEKREEFLRKAVEGQPASYRAWIALAQFYLSPVRLSAENAERYAREALGLDRSRVEAYGLLAEVYADREKWDELDSILAAGTKEVPDDLAPYYRAAGRLLASGRDLPRAERYLRTYLGQESEGNEPTLAEAHWKLGLLLEKERRKSEADDEWREALRLDPRSPAARELKRRL